MATDQTDLSAQLQVSADVLEHLLEVSKRINSTLDLSETVDHIITAAKEVMQADAASLMLRDGDELVFEVALGSASQALRDHSRRMPIGDGVAGYVARSGEPLRFDDVYNDERFSRDFDERTGYRTRSMLCVPLHLDGEIIGVAQVINKTVDGAVEAFSTEDLSTFTAFCGMAAIALGKAKLHLQLLDRERMAKELELAQAIQQSFLTHDLPFDDALRFQAENISARELGGDFYDAFELPGGKLGVVVGDVSGKGTVAALYMARFMSEFRFVAELADSPAAAIGRANDMLAARTTRGMFITLMYVLIDPTTLEADVVNAGHPQAVLRQPDGGTSAVADPSGPPLGIIEGHAYAAERIALAPGASFSIFTDGIVEARAASGEEFGLERIINCVEAAEESVFETIRAAVRSFVGDARQHDDLTLVTLQAHRDAE